MKILLRKVTVVAVLTDTALEPNSAPDDVPAILTVLKCALTVVPPVMLIPFSGFAAFAAGVLRSPTRLLCRVTVVPAETNMPFTAELALLPERSQTLFLNTLVVEAPVTAIPDTVDVPVVDRVLTLLLLILIRGEVFEHLKPVTAPPAPVEVKLLMLLEAIVRGFALLPEALIFKPTITPCPVMLLMVLLETVEVVAPK